VFLYMFPANPHNHYNVLRFHNIHNPSPKSTCACRVKRSDLPHASQLGLALTLKCGASACSMGAPSQTDSHADDVRRGFIGSMAVQTPPLFGRLDRGATIEAVSSGLRTYTHDSNDAHEAYRRLCIRKLSKKTHISSLPLCIK
jgi:hypothetical protein